MHRLLVSIIMTLALAFTAQAANLPYAGPDKTVTSPDGWTITATDHSDYHGVLLGNGHIGLVSDATLFHSHELVLAGVFDSRDAIGISRVQGAPIFTDLDIYVDGEKMTLDNTADWSQTIDMKHAMMTTEVTLPHKCKVTYTLMALRNLPYSAIANVEIDAKAAVSVRVVNSYKVPSSLKNVTASFKDGIPVYWVRTSSFSGRHTISSASIFTVPSDVEVSADGLNGQSFLKNISRGEKFAFTLSGAACSTKDFKDPTNEAKRQAIFCWKQKPEVLVSNHEAAWADLWKGDIEIEGNDQLQQEIRLALYHLYASTCTDISMGLAPMGLSTTSGYNGHYFWDCETWMFPPLMVLNQQIGKSLLGYRYDGLSRACQNAANHGFQGAMYPWEGDTDYEEVTPVWALTGAFEHHITADVAIAMWEYYEVYGDKTWLRETGYPVIKAVADFWKSRVTPLTDGKYSILNVVGADEYAVNVDDNAYTNGAAKLALLDAAQAADALGLEADPSWKRIADGMMFYYDEDGVMLEYSDYSGQTIKQADVNLLAYPLGLIQDHSQIKKDVEYYRRVMDPNGPAMGDAILSILYQRIGESGPCYQLFLDSYRSRQRAPFGVFAESPKAQNPYFMTGAGGFLQAVIFGFGGLEITPQGIVQHPSVLPEGIRSLTIKGVGPERKTFTVKGR